MATKVQPKTGAEFSAMSDKAMSASDVEERAKKIEAAFARDKAFNAMQCKVLTKVVSFAPRVAVMAEKLAKKASDVAMTRTFSRANFADAVAILKSKM